MTGKDLFKRVYTRKELKILVEKTLQELEVCLKKKDYRMTSFYSLDLARIYDLLNEKKKAEQQYTSTLEYVDRSGFPLGWVTIECLYALGKFEKALTIELSDPYPNELWLAFLYEKIGDHDSAQTIYANRAPVQSHEGYETFTLFQPHYLQKNSDFWEKAQNAEKARKYNQRAVQTWEKIKDNIVHLDPIEEAWLYEEVGYIYEKAGRFETAMEHYKKAKGKYEIAYTKDLDSTEVNKIDGTWDYYREHFSVQLFPEIRFIDLMVDSINHDFRRIKYRILNLKEQMNKV